MDFNKFFQSHALKMILIGLAFIVLVLAAFKAGEMAEYKRAAFSYRWAENYHRNFGGPRGGFFGDFDDRAFQNANGTFGTIIKIDSSTNTLTVKDQDNVEKPVFISGQTTIRKSMETIQFADLQVDSKIVVIGSANEKGQIEAKFIRVFP